jgi:RecA-family ATPase/5S rRNA maturation endonuclease (ribonuclease M5)
VTAYAAGKIFDLAFGFQGGVGAYKNFAPEDNDADEAKIKTYRDGWRRQHPQTVKFWNALDRAAINAIRHPGTAFAVRCFSYRYDAPFLRLKLPSGRSISYPFAEIMPEPDRFGNPRATFMDTAEGRWAPCNHGQGAYGGLWCENAISGVARDLLAVALTRLEASGYPVVLHVHDEIVCEVPDGFGSLGEFQHIITTVPGWATGLPIVAKVRESARFSRPDAAPKSDDIKAEPDDAEPDDAEPNIEADRDEVAALLGDLDDDTGDFGTVDFLSASAGAGVEVTPAAAVLYCMAPPLAIVTSDANSEPEDHGGGNGFDHAGADATSLNSGDRGAAINSATGAPSTDPELGPYIYRDARGNPHAKVTRTPTGNSRFTQQHWTGMAWQSGAPDHKLRYRLPELLAADPAARVCITEGEKDAVNVAKLGLVATTNPNGADGWKSAKLIPYFAHVKRIAILEDNDEAGRKRTQRIIETLRMLNPMPDIRVVRFTELPEGGDVSNWLEQDRSRGYAELLARIEATKPFYCKPQPAPIREWAGKPVPVPQYTVPDRIPAEQVFLFSGEGGEGKSILIQQLCSAHVLEREWLGCTPRQNPAIYLECEDAERVLWWRQAAIAEYYGVPIETFADAGLQLFSLIEHDTILAATNRNGIVEPTAFYDWLYELAGDIKPVMIGIASSANVFAGNENIRPEVQQFVKLLTRITLVSGGSLTLISHPSISGVSSNAASHEGLSGTTQWHNAVRARAVMKGVKSEDGIDTGLRSITFHKNQYGPPSATCFVRYNNGLFLPVEGMSMDVAERAAKADEIFITLLKRFTAQRQMVSPHPSSAYAPKRFAEHPEAQGITKDEFKRAMQRLLDAGAIEIRDWGRVGRKTKYLAVRGSD